MDIVWAQNGIYDHRIQKADNKTLASWRIPEYKNPRYGQTGRIMQARTSSNGNCEVWTTTKKAFSSVPILQLLILYWYCYSSASSTLESKASGELWEDNRKIMDVNNYAYKGRFRMQRFQWLKMCSFISSSVVEGGPRGLQPGSLSEPTQDNTLAFVSFQHDAVATSTHLPAAIRLRGQPTLRQSISRHSQNMS